ncbi:MAG: chromosome segregation protein SMC [Candidatus Riflebacteria bacterium]|nr:chromosome segregation protein SMC [Candidatus Riflebacteria bacterium]
MKEVIAKELVLDNFKSFGKRTTIPLLEGFTTISGPNGSGKSNILDSLLFCLGLTTSKTLRAERLPDLINNRSNRNDMKVTLRLEVKGVPGLVEISRAVRVGKNDYHSTFYLDNRPVSLQAVHERLAELNISPKGHNIIMQGDVTRILTMSPVERRKIIDDLAGVGEFDDRIESARKEMEEANRHMDSTRILAVELTTRLEGLRAERDQALTYLGVRNEKERLEKTLLCRRFSDASRTLSATRTRISTLSRECTDLNDRILALEAQQAAGKERFFALDREIQGQSAAGAQGGAYAELETIKEKLQRAVTFVEYVKATRTTEEKRQQELAVEIKKAEAERDELDVHLRADLAERNVLEAQLATARESMNALLKRRDSLSEANAKHLADLPTLRKQRDDARELGTALNLEDQKLGQEAVTSEQVKVKATGEGTRLTAAIADAKGRQKKKTEEVKTAQAETQRITYELHDARTALKERSARLDELQELYRKVLKQYSTMQGIQLASAESSGSAALSLVLNSGIKGIHGRVADLMEIPDEYRVALEAAAGRRMEFVVVSDENVAVAAIELLKERRAGRVTCLPLTKIRGGATAEPPARRTGILGMAIDLIRFDPKYRNVFSFVIGDTLVIDNIRTGLPLMGQFRMVSLEGDLLERTGAMTGGSPPALRRAAPELDMAAKKRTLDAIEAEAQGIRKLLPDLEKKVADLEEKLQRAKSSEASAALLLSQIAGELERLTSELNRAQADLDGAQKAIARIVRERETMARESAKAAEQVKQRELELLAVENGLTSGMSKELAEEVKFAEGQIKQQEEKLHAVKQRIRERQLKREFHQTNASGLRREFLASQERVATQTDQVEASQQEQEDLRRRQVELTAQVQAALEGLAAKREERDTLARRLEALGNERDQLRIEFTRKETELNEARTREAQIAEDVAKLSAELATAQIDPAAFPWKGPIKELEQSIAALTEQLTAMGAVNLKAIDQSAEEEKRLAQLNEKLTTLDREKQELLERMTRFGRMKREAFLETFAGVKDHYERIYRDLSRGQGELQLECPDDPFAGGLVIRACPKGKDMKRIDALSGGEKSLAALAFVFAFQSYKPAPFYIFDEVDMFLDYPNTECLAEMIRRQADGTQFIVVSLKKCMIERSHRTVGVYASEGGHSQVAGLDLTSLVQDSREAAVGAGPWN